MNFQGQGTDYRVTVFQDPTSGRVIGEIWISEAKQIERPGDLPAVIEYCSKTGEMILQEFFKAGKLHRDNDRPARLRKDAQTGVVVQELWSVNGRRHRNNGRPSFIQRDAATGKTVQLEYSEFGVLHRSNGPAKEVFHSESGHRLRAEYWHRGVRTSKKGLNPPFGPT